MNDWFLEQLKKAGHKITGPRKQIAAWIGERGGVFSANELLSELRTLDKVSVYRTLELFSDLDIIHSVITHHGEKHYEVHGEKHHHHVICTGCEKTSCIPCTLKKEKIKGFTSLHHSFIVTGLCTSCAAGQLS